LKDLKLELQKKPDVHVSVGKGVDQFGIKGKKEICTMPHNIGAMLSWTRGNDTLVKENELQAVSQKHSGGGPDV